LIAETPGDWPGEELELEFWERPPGGIRQSRHRGGIREEEQETMSDDFYLNAAAQRANEIHAERQAALADLAAHRANGDLQSAAQSVQALADLDSAQQRLQALCNDYVAAQQGPNRPWVSDEQRAARQPSEMDSEDMAGLVRTSKYSKNFTSADYDRLRTGLNYYKASRGLESK
jgi:hypothetical protein